MLKFGMLVDFEALIKGEIEKLKLPFLQHLKLRSETYELNELIVKIQRHYNAKI